MTSALAGPAPATAAAPGVVTGRPRTWLRVEGLAIAVAALLAYAPTGAPWWLVPALFLVPDLSALGYLAGNRVGAAMYNLVHTYVLPLALLGYGLWGASPLALSLALIWLAHIGMDRAVAYGLKYATGFKDPCPGYFAHPAHSVSNLTSRVPATDRGRAK